MTSHTRREFLAEVGRGMVVATVGYSLASELGLATAFALPGLQVEVPRVGHDELQRQRLEQRDLGCRRAVLAERDLARHSIVTDAIESLPSSQKDVCL